ncbi:MAG: LPS assembly lipoprotein LptE [Ascidiaceihabitans sp.]|jgi:LPS-assembly lipoprotein|nr:LPS assembly lipoprotein LptE [Ascidiaceihabitans sp.]
MSLFKYLLILPFLALTACGFTPIYGTDGSANVLLNSVLVQEPKTRDLYLLTRQLEKRLGRAADPRFDLVVSVSTSLKALGINSIGNINRYNLLGTAQYTLRDTQTGQIVGSGKVNSFTSSSAAGSTISSQATREDAQERLMIILADKLIDHLIANADLPS